MLEAFHELISVCKKLRENYGGDELANQIALFWNDTK